MVKVEDKCAVAVTIGGSKVWVPIACRPEEPGERGVNETLGERGKGREREVTLVLHNQILMQSKLI